MSSIELHSNTELTQTEGPWKPQDGGLRAWLVTLTSFLIGGLLFGILNTYSVIYVELLKNLEQNHVADASYKASLVGSLGVGFMFLFSPLAGVLTDAFGIRVVSLTGGALAAAGMLASSWLVDTVEALYFTYGIMFGVGASLMYTPSLAILGLHFHKRLGLVNGLVTAGESVFTVALPPVLGAVIKWAGLPGALRFHAGCMLFLMTSILLYTVPEGAPRQSQDESPQCCPPKFSSIINVEIWRVKRYVIWVIFVCFAVFGYFVPYVHISQLVSISFPERDGNQMVMFIGVTSGFARVIFGRIADLPRVNRVVLQQVSFVSTGVLTMLITVAPGWWYLVAIALAMGVFDGCFISQLGTIPFDLCGQKNGAQAIGFFFGLLSVPLTVGPPIAGYIFDRTNSYYLPFLLAGCPPIIGGLALTVVHCVSRDAQIEDAAMESSGVVNEGMDHIETNEDGDIQMSHLHT